MRTHFDLAVIGQGYAGLCAARLARRRGLSVAAFEGVMVGGAVMTVLRLDPSPEAFTTSGPDLGAVIGMDNMDEGVVPFLEPVTGLDPAPPGGWLVRSPGATVSATQVVVATGTRPRPLGVPGEEALDGRGVSRCADCDGPEMVGRDCVVVGGGDAAFQEAAILARIARSVTIVMRGGAPRARPDLVAAVAGKAAVLRGRRVTAILGEDRVSGVRLDDFSELRCAGVFVFIGGSPETALLPAGVARDDTGAWVTDGRGSLGISGLWAVGSVRAGFTGGLERAGEDARLAIAAMAP